MAKRKARGLSSPLDNDLDLGFGALGQEQQSRNWFSRAGMGLLAYFASGTNVNPYYKDAEQFGPAPDGPNKPSIGYGCCQPAIVLQANQGLQQNPPVTYCENPTNSSYYKCPTGSIAVNWTCPEGTKIMGCGECTENLAANICWRGPWPCSTWWAVNP